MWTPYGELGLYCLGYLKNATHMHTYVFKHIYTIYVTGVIVFFRDMYIRATATTNLEYF